MSQAARFCRLRLSDGFGSTRTFTAFSPVQQNVRTRSSTRDRRLHSGSLAQSAASQICGPCTASNGTCRTRRFSDPCGIYPVAGRKHRKYPRRRAQKADCGCAIHVAHLVVHLKARRISVTHRQRPAQRRDVRSVRWSHWLGFSVFLHPPDQLAYVEPD